MCEQTSLKYFLEISTNQQFKTQQLIQTPHSAGLFRHS